MQGAMKRDLLPDHASETMLSDQGGPWRYAVLLLAGAILWTLGWYASTAESMFNVWIHSDTFAHGIVVIPIVLWLVWQKKAQLAAIAPKPSWPAVLALCGAGFAWLMGELAATNAV